MENLTLEEAKVIIENLKQENLLLSQLLIVNVRHAYEDGYNEGYTDGRHGGYEKGYDDGYDEGCMYGW